MDGTLNRKLAYFILTAAALVPAGQPNAAIRSPSVPQENAVAIDSGPYAAQQNGMTLAEAVESVRRRGNVERVISAETRVRNGREVHYIRVMTKDGRVQTVQVRGRSVN
jgi:hypothetical protein